MKHTFARRRGNIVAMTAVLMIVLISFVALAVDVGYLYTVRNELQRAADAAAIAATWELIDKNSEPGTQTAEGLAESARNKAVQFAALNRVGNAAPALATSDVNVGYISDPSDPSQPMVATPTGKLPNAVFVRIQRTSAQNGEIPLFFARAFGFQQAASQAQATAALRSGAIGFTTPSDGSSLGILPFALDEETWNSLSINGTDSWCYNPSTKTVTAGCDGILECNLYPQGTGQPGNRGTVDIGGPNNNTADIKRQIVDGVSATDLSYMGGELKIPEDTGILHLYGDTGISAGVKEELASIIGQPKIIPIFRTVFGPGNNADYSIVKFVGIRVLDVKLTGSMASKRLTIQPCNVVIKGAIYSEGATRTDYVYSPVWLVR
jgi:Flp pilus assembly protein TadG